VLILADIDNIYMRLFELDSAKADVNLEKHGVDFIEAAMVFDDDLAYVGPDEAHSIEPGDTEPRNAKVTVNMYLDGDIVQFFKNRAKRPGSAKYQTQINNALRDWMNLNQDEVFDSALIDAIAKQVERRLAER
jgi:uncharacterized DUF497 family protein